MNDSVNGDEPTGPIGIIQAILATIKACLGPIDAIIDQFMMQICSNREPTKSYPLKYISCLATSCLIVVLAYMLSLLLNSITLGNFLEKFLAQPEIVIILVCILLPLAWCVVLGIVVHNRQISSCEAASLGTRTTLWVMTIVYAIIWAAT
ncbi:MAG: hypothetical protein ABJM29_13385 [Rhizobiaceae bacterium]